MQQIKLIKKLIKIAKTIATEGYCQEKSYTITEDRGLCVLFAFNIVDKYGIHLDRYKPRVAIKEQRSYWYSRDKAGWRWRVKLLEKILKDAQNNTLR